MIARPRGLKSNSGPEPSMPKGKVLVDMGSAIIADAVSSLLQSYGYQCYTKEPPTCLEVRAPDGGIIPSAVKQAESVCVIMYRQGHQRPHSGARCPQMLSESA